jgi:hypothetical protein
MPTNDSVGLHNSECSFPVRPKPAEKNPEKPIKGSKGWFRLLGFVNCKLLPQSKNLKQQRLPRAKGAQDSTEEEPQRSEHEPGYSRR